MKKAESRLGGRDDAVRRSNEATRGGSVWRGGEVEPRQKRAVHASRAGIFAMSLAAILLVVAGCRPGTEAANKDNATVASHKILPRPKLAYPALVGKTLFDHYCAVCHGAEGQGDGFNSYNLDPKPQDLSDPKFQKSRTDSDLVAVIRTGGGAAGLSNEMPPWSPTLTDRQIGDLVIYIRTLGKKPEKKTGKTG